MVQKNKKTKSADKKTARSKTTSSSPGRSKSIISRAATKKASESTRRSGKKRDLNQEVQEAAHIRRPDTEPIYAEHHSPEGSSGQPSHELGMQQVFPDLPKNYGDNLIYLLVRDPQYLYTYWEIQKGHENGMLMLLGGSWHEVSRVLRVFDLTEGEGSPDYFDIHLDGGADCWFIHVSPNRSYLVEIGLLHKDGRYLALARSNEARTPRDNLSDVIDEKWMSVDYERIYALSGGYEIGKSSMELQRWMEEYRRLAMSAGSGASWLTGAGGSWVTSWSSWVMSSEGLTKTRKDSSK